MVLVYPRTICKLTPNKYAIQTYQPIGNTNIGTILLISTKYKCNQIKITLFGNYISGYKHLTICINKYAIFWKSYHKFVKQKGNTYEKDMEQSK